MIANPKEQVESLIGQIASIEDDSDLDIEEQIEALLDLSENIQALSNDLVQNEQQLAKSLLSAFVNSAPWLEADYGPDGFYEEHTELAFMLFDLGQNWPDSEFPDSFASEQDNFCYCAGLAMNPSLTLDKVAPFLESTFNYGYGLEEDAILSVALILNPNSTSALVEVALEQLSELQVGLMFGLISGQFAVYGNSSESTQNAIFHSQQSAEALNSIKRYLESHQTDMFNEATNWSNLHIDSKSVIEAIDTRLASMKTNG